MPAGCTWRRSATPSPGASSPDATSSPAWTSTIAASCARPSGEGLAATVVQGPGLARRVRRPSTRRRCGGTRPRPSTSSPLRTGRRSRGSAKGSCSSTFAVARSSPRACSAWRARRGSTTTSAARATRAAAWERATWPCSRPRAGGRLSATRLSTSAAVSAGRSDSLFDYKRRFAPEDLATASVGKAVHDEEAYRRLAGVTEIDFDGFFPAYRDRARSLTS